MSDSSMLTHRERPDGGCIGKLCPDGEGTAKEERARFFMVISGTSDDSHGM